MASSCVVLVFLYLLRVSIDALPGSGSNNGNNAEHEGRPPDNQPNGGQGGSTGGGPSVDENRKKRNVYALAGKWPSGVVNWEIYGPSESYDYRMLLKYVMAMYEYYTVLEFIEKPNNYTGPHAIFNCTGGAMSVVGMYGNGQEVECCRTSSCTHEIGHMLGMMHEHRNPLRESFIDVNVNNALSNWYGEYYRSSSAYWPASKFKTYGYFDYASPMLYPNTWNVVDGTKPTYRFYDTDLGQLKEDLGSYGVYWNSYYLAYQLNDFYNFETNYCTNVTFTCKNKGYIAKIDGTCQCRCPTGMSSSSNCTSEETTDTSGASLTWPADSYVLLKPNSGCPSGFHNDGSITHTSTNTVTQSSLFDASSTIQSNSITHNFCAR